ncbi:hypothetical protein V495_04851 [Pseudogymnoascus sp. VKM F-4514 (FW-929)]|nr:hypothetical protein V495_04851 [Pseudogymnoascus sp. VKM F-4514 (FW-929)]KFY60252.1 hypothetical protein V497_03742 [Pseudogymnoascus sp. VKM F-4516 (FW-969)]
MFLEVLQIPNDDSAAETTAGCRPIPLPRTRRRANPPPHISQNGFPPRRQLPRSQTGHHSPPILLRPRPSILLAAPRKIQHPPPRAHRRNPPAHHHAANGRAVQYDDRERRKEEDEGRY